MSLCVCVDHMHVQSMHEESRTETEHGILSYNQKFNVSWVLTLDLVHIAHILNQIMVILFLD